MITVTKSLIRSTFYKCMVNSVRTAAYWNKDWKPGPYPETQAQREAAARKYNLLPEEYEPDPEGFGDYPDLPIVSDDSKDPHHNWDYPEIKKDYGEPMHVWANVMCDERCDFNYDEKQKQPPHKQFLHFVYILLGFFIPYIWLEDKKICLPHMRQHMLGEGPHYKYPE